MEIKKTFVLKNKLGVHARVAAKIVGVTGRYRSVVTLEHDGIAADGKSILSILTLACPLGGRLAVTADGEDAQIVIEEIARLISDKFGEE
ncbi:MAG: HPr family phosphocarrier protein [Deltaproteobacteria bacterium]|nr:HPr family phosphocarrier protein [Deltaproteobacteria bacterium]